MPPKNVKKGSKITKAIPMSTADLDMYFEALSLCGVNGYEAEVNHTIGLCKSVRTEVNLIACCALANTYKYKTKRKHRLIYAARRGNSTWFALLSAHTSSSTLESSVDDQNRSLYHNVSMGYPIWSKKVLPKNDAGRIQIIRELQSKAKNLDMHHYEHDLPIGYAYNARFLELVNEYIAYYDKYNFSEIDQIANSFLLCLLCSMKTCTPTIVRIVQRLCRIPTTEFALVFNDNDTTPFMYACKNGHVDIVKIFLQYVPDRIDINFSSIISDGTPLLSAMDGKILMYYD